MSTFRRYLKKHTEALVKDVGIEAACDLTGKSKATLGRYYSDYPEHADRFIPVDAAAALEEAASFPMSPPPWRRSRASRCILAKTGATRAVMGA